MDWRETFRMAFDTLLTHKFRSFLTVLGIVVGVSVVIVIAAILSGVKQNVLAEIESLGANNIMAYHRDMMPSGRPTREERMRRPLTVADAKAIREQCPSVRDVCWIGAPTRTRITIRNEKASVRGGEFMGVSYNYSSIYDLKLANGRFFTQAEDDHRVSVAILGHDTAKSLFADSDPVGRRILVLGRPFTVLGVAEQSRTGSMLGAADNYVYIPYGAFHKLMPWEENHYLYIQARPGMRAQALDESESLLRLRRRVGYSEPSDFSLTTPDMIIKQLNSITAIFGIVLIAVSSVGLLVGGIGVMNIMLVSVTERTREIGTRKALGATKRDIVLQFLFEAMTLTGLGGVFGVLFAVALSLVIVALVPNLPATIPLWAVFTGLGVSIAIGLIFGVWPARKAAMLDPIEALRYE
ncbi:MAG: ABC transporter permease [Acidobacteriota bacterium]|jgi:putative ABC transport system permease protein|nr:ABC transporter permease [Acidobacteriota bacterium]